MSGLHSRWDDFAITEHEEEEEDDPTVSATCPNNHKNLSDLAKPWRCEMHKFGGTSMKDMAKVGSIISSLLEGDTTPSGNNNSSCTIVTVSAIGGITDLLVRSLDQARQRDQAAYQHTIETVVAVHRNMCKDLKISHENSREFLGRLDKDCSEILDVLRCISLCGNASTCNCELVSGYGELWSARLLVLYLEDHSSIPSVCMDAGEVLVVHPKPSPTAVESSATLSNMSKDSSQIIPRVDWETSRSLVQSWKTHNLLSSTRVLVITGYVCRYRNGTRTTLGRNGSDYSASILGVLLKCRCVHIWTDVCGIYSCNPAECAQAKRIPSLSYEQAMQLSVLGASVLHTHTILPAALHNIPIRIRSTFAVSDQGTLISRKSAHATSSAVCLSSIHGLCLLVVEGGCVSGMDVEGVWGRLTGCLGSLGVEIVGLVQSRLGTRYRVCVGEDRAEECVEELGRVFYRELDMGLIRNIGVKKGLCLVSAVGDEQITGVCASVCGALWESRVDVVLLYQGSEHSVSLLVHSEDVGRALRGIHEKIYSS